MKVWKAVRCTHGPNIWTRYIQHLSPAPKNSTLCIRRHETSPPNISISSTQSDCPNHPATAHSHGSDIRNAPLRCLATQRLHSLPAAYDIRRTLSLLIQSLSCFAHRFHLVSRRRVIVLLVRTRPRSCGARKPLLLH